MKQRTVNRHVYFASRGFNHTNARNGKGTTKFPFPTSKNTHTTTNKLESTNYLISLHT